MNKILVLGFFLLFSSVANASLTFDQAVRIYKRLVEANKLVKHPRLVLNQSDSVNASYFNGVIEVNKGMLREVRNESELAWVLGHELGHYYDGSIGSSHTHEYIADRYAVFFQIRAGYNACIGIKLLLRFPKGPSPSHPDPMDRYERLGNKCYL